MSVGLSAANLANRWLAIIQAGTAFPSPPAGLYFKLHVGDPGAAGTANPSAVTTRVAAPYSAPAAGAIAQTGTPPSWTMTATETISHVSVWDAVSGGNFLFSFALTVSQPVVSSNTFTMTTYSLSLTPVAA